MVRQIGPEVVRNEPLGSILAVFFQFCPIFMWFSSVWAIEKPLSVALEYVIWEDIKMQAVILTSCECDRNFRFYSAI